jgi:hypothetical protein
MVDADRTAVNEAVVQPSADAAFDRHRDRLIAIALAVTVVIGLGGGAWIYALQRTTNDLHGQVGTLSTQVRMYSNAGQQLAAQVRGLGATPVVSPPPARAEQGPAGQAGAAGVVGQKGDRGDKGDKGDSGQPGKPGASGVPGVPGQPGQDGADGTDGALGQPGEKGDPGQNGTDGQPPAGWTATYSDGSTETCARAADFDPAAPQYTCTISPPPTTPILPGN